MLKKGKLSKQYLDYIKELKDSKYNFIELDENNIKEIKFDDIVFLKIAELGAMGEHGGIEILSKNKKFYHTNLIENINSSDFLLNHIPELEKLMKMRYYSDIKYFEFDCFNLGVGNYLYVNGKYLEMFKTKIKDINKKCILYQTWKDIAINILNEKHNDNKTINLI